MGDRGNRYAPAWVVGDYLIFYVIEGDSLVTWRVLHGARDLETALEG